MPEQPEVRILGDYINLHSENQNFTRFFFVDKGNVIKNTRNISNECFERVGEFYTTDKEFPSMHNFTLYSHTAGKEMKLYLVTTEHVIIRLSVFFGMNGKVNLVKTKDWNKTPYVRLRLDRQDGYSLLIHGGYLGPKIKLGNFNGTKRGPDPTQDYDKFVENINKNIKHKTFDKPICEVLLNQQYFSGIGNYLRSTILYYLDVNPFLSARDVITKNPKIFELCKECMEKSYQLNGGQLRDWINPFGKDSKEYHEWVYYKKGESLKDSTGRTFWYNPKWKRICTLK
jgi:formamidopyrimidine-DNA glycosylase